MPHSSPTHSRSTSRSPSEEAVSFLFLVALLFLRSGRTMYSMQKDRFVRPLFGRGNVHVWKAGWMDGGLGVSGVRGATVLEGPGFRMAIGLNLSLFTPPLFPQNRRYLHCRETETAITRVQNTGASWVVEWLHASYVKTSERVFPHPRDISPRLGKVFWSVQTGRDLPRRLGRTDTIIRPTGGSLPSEGTERCASRGVFGAVCILDT
ncbi:hypothetical protein GQ53DRAFT_384241 [Thozetella sp. PMI_491]|nr:hypothetical protein GQ53DRAFT_384241 [Thozetella sp. PMI_491]